MLAQRPSRSELSQMFKRFISAEYVIDDLETMKPYECDGLSMYCQEPMLVLLPDTLEQLQKVLQICHRYSINVVARGAGTGLCAGAMPDVDGVLLSLAKFDQILSIDADSRTEAVIACSDGTLRTIVVVGQELVESGDPADLDGAIIEHCASRFPG